ncbi:lycopene cyclase domain-containing protein [Pseudolysinimonas sp.]|uniref:lycopene cyclase domain-containing protein n=1 Tax=Pseudolysinimonas sp. TaxID=2680009 RepID=UPI00286B3EB4|nr:lycopene cyclase domain-containing protein [Pseudolysinimonas sp.]
MTYWALNAVFLGVVGLVAVTAIITRRAPLWGAIGLTAIPLLILTAVFDNVLVGTGIVGYDPALISGAKVGVAPLEDFAYTIAALVLLPPLWSLLGGGVSIRAPRYSTSGSDEVAQ